MRDLFLLFQISFILVLETFGVFLHIKRALPIQSYKESLQEEKSWAASTQNCAKCVNKDSKFYINPLSWITVELLRKE